MPSLQTQAEAIAALYQPPTTGRPSDIGSASTVQQVLDAIGDGNYLETAAKLAGLSKVTVYEWLKRGQTGEEPFATFANAVEKAEARAEAQMVANVRKASNLPQFWAAAATHLERRHPDRWGKRQDDNSVPKVIVQIGVGQGDVKVGIQVSSPTFAPDVLQDDTAKLLSDKTYAVSSSPIIKNYVNEPETALPVTIGESRRADPEGDPTPVVARAGGQRSPAQRKGQGRLARHQAKLAQTRKKAHRQSAQKAAVGRQDGVGTAIK